MKINARKIGLACGGILFAVGTIWVHYEVKAVLEPAAALGSGSLRHAGTLEIGEPMPDFSSVSLDGNLVSLSEFQGDEVVVIDFWATWCKPCIKGMPDLQDIHKELGEEGVEVLAVNVGERVDKVQGFMERESYSFRVVMDPDKEIKDLYGVGGIPQLIVVDKRGRPRHIEVGYPMSERQAEIRKQRLRNLIKELLREPSPSSTRA